MADKSPSNNAVAPPQNEAQPNNPQLSQQNQTKKPDSDSNANTTSVGSTGGGNASKDSNSGSSKQNVEFIFLAKIDNARVIASILAPLVYKKEQIATIKITKTGIKFTVEQSRTLQGNAFLQEALFQEYNYHGESVSEEFGITLSVLLECLNIFGTSPSFPALQIAYKGYGHPLLLMLEENDVLTDCGLRTIEVEQTDYPVFNLRATEIFTKIIIKSESLRDAFNELDWSNSTVILKVSPSAPNFRLSTSGTGASCQVDYFQESEVFESFECKQAQSFEYKLKLLQPCIKALAVSKKTQVRINTDGLLSLQHMIQTEDGQLSFVDFFIVPQELDANSDEE